MENFIHQSVYVDAGATIGKGCRIWHFCHIMSGASIGSGSILGQNVFIGRNVQVGSRVKIQNNVSVYEGVTLADDVFLGPSVVFTNVKTPRSFIERKSSFQPTYVARGASIGANATIICGVTIGEYAMVGAGSVITKDVQDHALMAGNPAVQIGWVGVDGSRLEFDDNGLCKIPGDGNIYLYENGKVVCSGEVK